MFPSGTKISEMSNRVHQVLSKDAYIRPLSTSFQTINDKDEDEIQRFLKPLFTLLKCLAIPTSPWSTFRYSDTNKVPRRRYRMLGWFVFALSLSCNIGLLYGMITNNSEFFYKMSTMAITLIISLTSDILFKLRNHLALLRLSSGSKIVKLMKTIRRLSFNGLKIRQYSKMALFVFLLVSLAYYHTI